MSAELELQALLADAIDEMDRTLTDCRSKLPASLEPGMAQRFHRLLEAAQRQRDRLVELRATTATLPAGQAAPMVQSLVPGLLKDFEALRSLVESLDTEPEAAFDEPAVFDLSERMLDEYKWADISVLGPADVLKPPPPPDRR